MVETSPNCTVDVDVNDALELSEVAVGKSFASRGLLFWEVYVDRGNISQHMVNHYPDVEVARLGLQECGDQEEISGAHGHGETALHMACASMHFVVTHAELECHHRG